MADQEPAKSPAPEAPVAATATTAAAGADTTTTTETSAPPPAEDPAPADPPSAQVAAQEAASGLLPGQHWGNLTEPAANDTDSDSAFGDNQSATTSIASSILNYRTIHGRNYHSERGDAQYWVTNDEESNEALDINHHVMSLILDGRLYNAPLKREDIKEVVDIGTGTGIWAIDFADEFPDAKVIGTDVSPIQPSWVPPNVQFQIDDCTQEWTFEENSLDYVHMRFLVGSIVDWPALYRQAYRALKPGGWIENHEGSPVIRSDDGTVKDKSAMQQWGPIFFKGGETIGRSFSILEDETQRKGLEAAGFTNIEESNHKIPIGGWAKDPTLREAGRFFQAAITTDIEGTLLFIANVLGWTKDEVAVFGAHYRSEIKNRHIHAYFTQKRVWAQKPLDA